MLKFLYRILCGILFAICTLAPGISGSIVAIIVGVYHDLLEAFSNPLKDLKKSLMLLIPVGIGVAIGIVGFVLVFDMIFRMHEKSAYLLFAGLIAGNIPIVVSQIKKTDLNENNTSSAKKVGSSKSSKRKNKRKRKDLKAIKEMLSLNIKKSYYFFLAGAMVITFVFGWLSFANDQSLSADAVTAGLPYIALGGLASGAALLIPGMSFSMILILMGLFGQLMYAGRVFLHMDTSYLLWLGAFGVSAIIGLAFASKLIKAAFTKYPGAANSAVLGFMLGSFLVLLVQGIQVTDVTFAWWQGVLALTMGLGISVLLMVLLRFVNNKSKREVL